jgi:hypothetical protein
MIFLLFLALLSLAQEKPVVPMWFADLCRSEQVITGRNQCEIKFVPYNSNVRHACSVSIKQAEKTFYGVIWNGYTEWQGVFNQDGTEEFIFRKVPTYEGECLAEMAFLFNREARLIRVQASRQARHCLLGSPLMTCEF